MIKEDFVKVELVKDVEMLKKKLVREYASYQIRVSQKVFFRFSDRTSLLLYQDLVLWQIKLRK